ncbi:sensor histidine kinase [Aureivirga sp. CE67]|uniref:sensor histidine kinase n=1 Tax=Aureivirga sp. CE67 TaxID=1788983 RepID=UPI0018CA1DD7|nr:histidine kinase [Aureivirga sp. CE67]
MKSQRFINKSKTVKEIIYQTIIFILLFLFYSFDKHNPKIDFYQFIFFLNYAIIAFFINYFLLPKYFYNKRYLKFTIGVLLLITFAIFIEEGVLEQIFFPDTRGKYFHGIFYSLLEIAPIILIFVGAKFAYDSIEKQKQLEELQSLVKESELQYLKSQINPHFLFNNLNNLYAYAIENSPKTPTIILELSSVLRYMLYDCREDFVSLTKEIDHLKNFTELSKLQIENRGEITFDIDIQNSDYKIAPLILNVFIENAFKHSTASQSENISIEISLEVNTEGKLLFSCKNSCLSTSNTDAISGGIGLENVQKRLLLLYPNQHHLEIDSAADFYKVNLELDLTKLNA